MSTIEETTARRPYALPNDAGVTDFWLPFVPGISRISTPSRKAAL